MLLISKIHAEYKKYAVMHYKIKKDYYILYDILSYDKKYDGYQVTKKIGAENANCG